MEFKLTLRELNVGSRNPSLTRRTNNASPVGNGIRSRQPVHQCGRAQRLPIQITVDPQLPQFEYEYGPSAPPMQITVDAALQGWPHPAERAGATGAGT